VIHGGAFTHPTVLVQQAVLAVEEFHSANCIAEMTRPAVQAPNLSWKNPPLEWHKINWDAAVCKDRGLVGRGVVVRNAAGEVVAARCDVARGFLDPCAAKAWAGLQAI
jgi:hypothetical protein